MGLELALENLFGPVATRLRSVPFWALHAESTWIVQTPSEARWEDFPFVVQFPPLFHCKQGLESSTVSCLRQHL